MWAMDLEKQTHLGFYPQRRDKWLSRPLPPPNKVYGSNTHTCCDDCIFCGDVFYDEGKFPQDVGNCVHVVVRSRGVVWLRGVRTSSRLLPLRR